MAAECMPGPATAMMMPWMSPVVTSHPDGSGYHMQLGSAATPVSLGPPACSAPALPGISQPAPGQPPPGLEVQVHSCILVNQDLVIRREEIDFLADAPSRQAQLDGYAAVQVELQQFEAAKVDIKRTLGLKIRGKLDEKDYWAWKIEMDKLFPKGVMGIWDAAARKGITATLRVELPPGNDRWETERLLRILIMEMMETQDPVIDIFVSIKELGMLHLHRPLPMSGPYLETING
jgi:hypothetical protein